MAIKKIQMIPEGVNDYADILHPETSSDLIIGQGMWGVTTGTNSYVVTISNITSLFAGVKATVKFSAANTAASTININGLGAKSITKAGGAALTAGNIKANGVYTLVYDGTSFQLQGEGGEYGTALSSDVLSPKTIGTDNGLVIGTIPVAPTHPNNNNVLDVHIYGSTNGGSATNPTNNVFVSVPKGYYDTTWVGATLPTLIESNIKSGVQIGIGRGITGTFTSDATIPDSSWMLTGASAYKNGAKIEGSMLNHGAVTLGIGTQGGVAYIPGGFHNGGGYVQAYFANLVAGNIRAGVDVGGVVGNYAGVTGIHFDTCGANSAYDGVEVTTTKTTTAPSAIKAICIVGNFKSSKHNNGSTKADSSLAQTFTLSDVHYSGSTGSIAITISGSSATMVTKAKDIVGDSNAVGAQIWFIY